MRFMLSERSTIRDGRYLHKPSLMRQIQSTTKTSIKLFVSSPSQLSEGLCHQALRRTSCIEGGGMLLSIRGNQPVRQRWVGAKRTPSSLRPLGTALTPCGRLRKIRKWACVSFQVFDLSKNLSSRCGDETGTTSSGVDEVVATVEPDDDCIEAVAAKCVSPDYEFLPQIAAVLCP